MYVVTGEIHRALPATAVELQQGKLPQLVERTELALTQLKCLLKGTLKANLPDRAVLLW